MTSFFQIVKLLFKDTYRPSQSTKKGGRIATAIAIAAIYLLFEVAIVTTLVNLAPYFREAVCVPEFLTTIMTFGLAAVTTLGIMPMLNLLYFSKDSEFFLSLPVSPSKVYFAKLFTVYVSQLIITALIVLPALYAVGIAIGLNWPFFLVMILAVLLLPCFPLLIISVICLPIMYIIRFFKNRGAAASILAVVLFMALFFGYMLAINLSSDMPDEAELINVLIGPVKRTANIFAPLLAINRFATFTKLEGYGEALSLLLNFLIFTVPALMLFTVTLIISRKAYSRAVANQLENPKQKAKGSLYQDSASAMKALIAKEWKGIWRTPVFVLQCFAGLIIAPIFFVIIGLGHSTPSDVVNVENGAIATWLFIAMFIQFIVITMNIGASTSFSRDGAAFYLNKLLPVSYTEQIKAKIILYNAIYGLDILLCVGIWFLFFGVEAWWLGLMLLVYLIIYNYGFISLCILLDISKPKLDWRSYREIVKNSRNAVLPVLIGLLSAIVVFTLAIGLFYILRQILSARLAAVLIGVLLIAGALAFAFVVRNILSSRAKKYFDRVEA